MAFVFQPGEQPLPGPRDEGRDGIGFHAEPGRRLRLADAFEAAQDEDRRGALGGGRSLRGPTCEVLAIRRRSPAGPARPTPRPFPASGAGPLSASPLHRLGRRPGATSRRDWPGREGSPSLREREEGCLEGVLGVGLMSEAVQAHAPDHRPVTLDEAGEGGVTATDDKRTKKIGVG